MPPKKETKETKETKTKARIGCHDEGVVTCVALCVMSGLIHTGLGLSSLIAHVLHSPPPPPANSFTIGPAVINTHSANKWRKNG